MPLDKDVAVFNLLNISIVCSASSELPCSDDENFPLLKLNYRDEQLYIYVYIYIPFLQSQYISKESFQFESIDRNNMYITLLANINLYTFMY